MTALRWLRAHTGEAATVVVVLAGAFLAVALQFQTWRQMALWAYVVITCLWSLRNTTEIDDLRQRVDERDDTADRALALAQACHAHLSEDGPAQTGRHADSAGSYRVTKAPTIPVHLPVVTDSPGSATGRRKGNAA